MYTIFKNDLSIILTDKLNFIKDKHYLLWKDIRKEMNLNQLIEEASGSICIYHAHLDVLWKEFKAMYKIIEASGGIVRNSKDDLLFILRHDKWDLPKGKIENGEGREEAAIREVKEECGFTQIDLGNYIGTTYHLYNENSKDILKLSYWYEMFSDQTNLKPQLEEGITQLKWLGAKDLDVVKGNTYSNIILLLDMYLTDS